MKAACLLSVLVLLISPIQLAAQSASTTGATSATQDGTRDRSVIVKVTGRLLAYYPFNGNANDQSGNGYNGIVVNATSTADRFGNPGKAFHFDGSKSYVRLGNILNSVFCAPIAKWTITGWASTESYPLYQGGGVIINKAAGGTYGPYQWSFDHDQDGRLKWSVESKFDASQLLEMRSAVVPTGRWFFYALVFDGSLAELDRVQLYVDSTAGTLSRHLGILGTTTESSNQEIAIGAGHAANNPFSPNNQYSGSIDDIRIYDYVLSKAEIDSLYHEGGWPVSLPRSATLSCISPPTAKAGNDFTVEIRVGDPTRTASLFGVGFVLNFTNTSYVDFVSADTSGCYLGGNLVYVITPDDANGKVSLGFSRKTPASGVTGGGTLVKLKFHVASLAPDNGMVVFSTSSATANDANGTSIFMSPEPGVTMISSGLVVWPGDADNSGLVNQNDVFPLGLHWGRTGPARLSVSPQWIAQPATSWTPLAAMYADANGDGVVDQSDVLPIGLNWGKTHSLGKAGPSIVNDQTPTQESVLGTPVLRATGPTSVGGRSTFDVNIILGDTTNPAAGLFGISFILDFAGSKGIIEATEVTQGTFLGNDLIFFPQVDNTNGSVAIGMTRKNGAPAVSGFGQVAKVRFQVVNSTSSSSMAFATRNISAIDANGNTVTVQPSSSSILSSAHEMDQVPIGFQLGQNYPNPFNPSTRIPFSIPKTTIVHLSVLDLLGREVAVLFNGQRTPGSYEVQWDATAHPSGIYICRIQAGELVQMRKMALIK